MPNPLFSTYTQGENRITSTFLAVLEHINAQLTEDILEALLDESAISLARFENQVTGVESVPDAAILASTSLWFETKTSNDAVDKEQLENHLLALDEETADLKRLIVLTPDRTKPAEVEQVGDGRLVWTNFDTLVDMIESVLDRDVGSTETNQAVPTEREAFLLREFVRFLYDEGLVSGDLDRVLVVAARKAWPEYHEYGLYFCQPNRSFKPVSHIAFYTGGEIKTAVPAVTGAIDSIELTQATVTDHPDLSPAQESTLLEAIERLHENDSERYGETEKVLFLEDDLTLEQPIQNDKTASDSDRTVAFVQGHRYVSLTKLRENPQYTTELEED